MGTLRASAAGSSAGREIRPISVKSGDSFTQRRAIGRLAVFRDDFGGHAQIAPNWMLRRYIGPEMFNS